MNSRRKSAAACAALAAACFAAGCTTERTPSLSEPTPLASPAGAYSGEPHLAVGSDGEVFMSWFERTETGHALKFSKLEGDRWRAPAVIAEGDSFFVNWADFPTVVLLDHGVIAAHYPWMNGAGTYAYDVRLRFSLDGGLTWGPDVIPHTDGTATEHGFVSLLPAGEAVRAVWLDGRKFATAGDGHDQGHTPGAEMTVRSAVVYADGRRSEEAELDGRACDCCQTAAVVAGGAVLTTYRDRSLTEVRDISLVRYENGAWSDPYPLHSDGWQITGCPVNGAALDAAEDRVVAAWYTAANDTPRVNAAFSSNGGLTFSAPVRLDGAKPIGRTDVVLLEDGDALVSWVEEGQRGSAIRVRRVSPDGRVGDPVTLSATSSERASGFPRMVRVGDRVLFAWTQVGEKGEDGSRASQVRVAETRVK